MGVLNKMHKMGVGNPNMVVGSQMEKDSGFYGSMGTYYSGN